MKKSILSPMLTISIVLLMLAGNTLPVKAVAMNNSSNIANQSIIASDGQSLFYGFLNGYDYSLMRSDINGENQTELVKLDKLPRSIRVTGGWVYYMMWYGIYKVKTDGSEHQEVVFSHDSISYINVVGEWIYFQKEKLIDNGGDVIESEYSIWKIKTDGTQEQKVIDDGGGYVTVLGNAIYYLSYSPNSANHGDYVLCKVGTDGLGKKVLLEDEPNIAVMVIYGNSIYCGRERSRPHAENAFTVDLNGKNKKELDFSATSMFIYDDSIYFSYFYNPPYDLYNYHIPTGDTAKVFRLDENIVGENSVSGSNYGLLSVVNRSIYFVSSIDKIDRSQGEKIYIAQRGLFRMDLTGERIALLSQGQ